MILDCPSVRLSVHILSIYLLVVIQWSSFPSSSSSSFFPVLVELATTERTNQSARKKKNKKTDLEYQEKQRRTRERKDAFWSCWWWRPSFPAVPFPFSPLASSLHGWTSIVKTWKGFILRSKRGKIFLFIPSPSPLLSFPPRLWSNWVKSGWTKKKKKRQRKEHV